MRLRALVLRALVLEARRISERTRAALAAAKARAARTVRRAKANATTKVVVEDIRRSGVETLAGIAKVLEARGVRTPAGSIDMAAVQVSRLLAA